MDDWFETRSLEDAPLVAAPDGSAVRSLCRLAGAASFAHFQLEPGEVSKAVSHATVQEIWYVVAGTGQMWRRQHGRERVTALAPRVCLTIPHGTVFQFRALASDASKALQVVAVTIPPWPVESTDQARIENGP